MEQEKSIFQQVQERYDILDVAANLGIDLRRVGSTYRANSIAKDGGGENAFTVYPDSNSWFDFKLNIGGDITDLVAFYKFDGDKKQALLELMPDHATQIDRFLVQRKQFLSEVEKAHSFLSRILDDPENHREDTRYINYLHGRGITDDYIRRLKIGVDHNWRLFFPYWDISGKNPVYFISRRAVDIYGQENENQPKYIKPDAKKYPFLHNTPWGLHTLNRGNEILFITEGQFDAMLLDQAGASVLTPNCGDFAQAWNDALNFAKKFKYVILAFDNDDTGQDFTFEAGKKLIKARIPFKCANFVGKDIAEFFQMNGSLDTLTRSATSGYCWMARRLTNRTSRNGITLSGFSDLTVAEKEETMSQFKEFLFEIAPMADDSDIEKIVYQVSEYFPLDWLKATKKAAKKGPDEMEFVQRFLDRYNLKYDDRTGLYLYNDKGYWEHITTNELRALIIPVIGKKCTYSKLAAVTKLVMAQCQARELITKLDKLPVFSLKNCTLHFDYDKVQFFTGEHSPNDYVTMQASYNLIKEAKSSIFLPALHQIFDGNEDSITTLQEFFGYCLLNDCRYHKALFALGVGGNGKSVVTDVLRAMLGGLNQEGRGLVSATMLSKLGKDFRTMVLKNSWVNISSETDIRLDGAEANFKIITSGEPIEDSYKGKDPVTFMSRTKLIINCNEFPIFNDKSKGLSRRILFVEFPVNFVDEPREGTNERKLDPDLVARITGNQEEMAAILLWAMQGLKRILKNKGFTITKTQKRLMREYDLYTNPILSFVEEKEHLLFDEEGHGREIHRTTLYDEFREWMGNSGEDKFSFSARRFYHSLENTFRAAGSCIRKYQEHGLGWMYRAEAKIA
ncbi:MAG: toprim domain-containing protein [Synergistaceae bacterium]|nr:toprim domain-containing protein [Synergistaceae bacterium]